MIEVSNLTFRYDGAGRDALAEVSLAVEDGGFLGIIGPGGAGKSTLLYAINGVVPYYYKGDFYGAVAVNGRDTLDAGPQALAGDIGSVFSDIDSQMVAAVVEDEVLFGLENYGVPREEIEGRIDWALGVTGIAGLRRRLVRSLSGGQKQKVAIAAILALRPKIIVLDEPTGELDPRASRRVFETLRELNEGFGITVVVVEQKIMLLCEFAKRLALMNGGRVILEGPVADVLARADVPEKIGVNIPRVATLARGLRARGALAGDTGTPRDVAQAAALLRQAIGGKAAGGKEPAADAPQQGQTSPQKQTVQQPQEQSPPVLALDRVHFAFNAAGEADTLLRDVSFQIHPGEFVALLGENGAGKSTLCRLCNGLLAPVSGTVTVVGRDTRASKVSDIAGRVGFLFQNPDRQICKNTVREEVLFSLSLAVGDAAEREARCAQTLAELGLDGDRDPFGMSRGERQLVALASILACRPQLLLLDEPTTGLDYLECEKIMGIVASLCAQGSAALMVSHDMEVVLDYAPRAVVLAGGEIVFDGAVKALMKSPPVLERASLLPAQIPALAMELGAGFENVYYIAEMEDAITARCGSNTGAAIAAAAISSSISPDKGGGN